jgi:hypothetical protein
VRGNYATLNPLNNAGANGTYSNGNLEVATGSSQYGAYVSTIATSTTGKWYAEAYITSGANTRFGFVKSSYQPSATEQLGNVAGTMAYRCDSGDFRVALTTKFTGGATCTSGDTVGLAIDLDSGEVKIYKNGSLQGTATGIESANWHFAGSDDNGSGTATHIWNFGQRPFAYTAPSGFKALNTANLPAPVVTKPNTVFDVITYTGNGSTRTLPDSNSTPTSLAFGPNLLWFKSRSVVDSAPLFDSVRGTNKALFSTGTTAEYTPPLSNGVTAFNSNGVNIGGYENINANGVTFVAWCWDAGEGDAVTNTQGSITSSVRANATAGFSIVTYTGNTTQGASVGHGLGVAPSMIIVKNRTSSGPSWAVGHTALGGWNKVLYLNLTDAVATQPEPFNGTTPTSTVFQLWDSSSTNSNGANYVAYCFAAVAGYSSFGSYVGNGSSTGDGPFIYTSHRPRFLLIKRTNSTGEWVMVDTARDTYNLAGQIIYANSSDAEFDDRGIGAFNQSFDFLSNGFKLKGGNARINANGSTYVYASFAEAPFNYSRAR